MRWERPFFLFLSHGRLFCCDISTHLFQSPLISLYMAFFMLLFWVCVLNSPTGGSKAPSSTITSHVDIHFSLPDEKQKDKYRFSNWSNKLICRPFQRRLHQFALTVFSYIFSFITTPADCSRTQRWAVSGQQNSNKGCYIMINISYRRFTIFILSWLLSSLRKTVYPALYWASVCVIRN